MKEYFAYKCPKTGLLRQCSIDSKYKKNLDMIKLELLKKDRDKLIILTGIEGCQPKGSKVLMANGDYKNIEDVKEGDLVLSPQQNGSNVFSKVLKTYDWFSKKTYDVCELNRNHRLLYSCSHNHEIPVNVKAHPRINGERLSKDSYWKVKHYEAEDYFKLSNSFKTNITTPTMFAIDKYKDRKDCEIEPYTLGVFLGDGSFMSFRKKNNNYIGSGYNGRYGKHKGNWLKRVLRITSNDVEIINEISKFYPIMSITTDKRTTAKNYLFSVKEAFSKILTKYGLEGKGSGEKFIPKEALLSSLEYRKRLLAGLIDTDGYYSNGGYEFTLKSKALIEGIRNLVYSIGGRCGEIRKVRKGIKKLNFVGTYYRINFYVGDIKLPIKLKRKIRDIPCFYLSPNRVSIEVKQNVGKQVYGFTLDSKSHWYVTDNFVITKNSGKTVKGIITCSYIDPTFNLSRICFSADEFKNAVMNAKQHQAVMFDEAHHGLLNRSALTKQTKMLVSLIQTCRQKNLFILIILPSVFMLDRYIALHRADGLVHTYIGKNNRHIFFVFDRKNKTRLILEGAKAMDYPRVIKKYKRSIWKGTFVNCYCGIDEDLYRKKKEQAFLRIGSEDFVEDKSMKMRNQIIYSILHQKFKLNSYKMAELFLKHNISFTRSGIERVLLKMKKEELKELEGGSEK